MMLKSQQQLQRQIAWVQLVESVSGMKTGSARKQHRPEFSDIFNLVIGDLPGQAGSLPRKRGVVPQTAGLQQRERKPEIGVGSRVAVRDLPCAVFALPKPSGQMSLKRSLRQVSLRPRQNSIEARPVVSNQRKEQRVGL